MDYTEYDTSELRDQIFSCLIREKVHNRVLYVVRWENITKKMTGIKGETVYVWSWVGFWVFLESLFLWTILKLRTNPKVFCL